MKTIHTEGWNKFSDNQKPQAYSTILVKAIVAKNMQHDIKIYTPSSAESIMQEFDEWKYLD